MPSDDARQLLRSAPYFPVADVERSAVHYERHARAVHAELEARGAEIVYGPIVQEAYQIEEFAVRDCEGYVLGFGQSLTMT